MHMSNDLRVLSVYEGFFTGGARILHSDVLLGLREGGQRHQVLSIHDEIFREAGRQRMEDDACYRSLTAAGIPVSTLGLGLDRAETEIAFSPAELATAARLMAQSDVVLSLKEQPLGLLNQCGLPERPVLVCLHRSDPENQGQALEELRAAVAAGRIAGAICCAESTRDAYRAAGIPGHLLHVVPNGADLLRFRPDPARRAWLRTSLGIAPQAPVVVFAARYAAMKNVPLLLRAARAFLEREPGGRVLMCGAGMNPGNAELRMDVSLAFAAEPELADRLILLGVRNDMETVYAAADVVALTSASGEAAPLCLIEGMMCGAVPVSTDIGDTARIVTGHGLLTGHDPEEIAAAWQEAIARSVEFAHAIARSRERFSRTRMIASYATLIARVRREVGRAPLH
jgi:glycosyltransferase involved in cell wall biosynthesis